MAGPSGEGEVTFFVPCLNAEKTLVPSIETILAAVRMAGCTFEIIVVDDHSADRSVPVVEDYMARHPDLPIRIVKNSRRQGLSRNYTDCAFIGRGTYYKFFGGSNMELANDVAAALRLRGTADMIVPYPVDDKRTLKRRIISKLYANIVSWITGYRLRYYNGPILHRRYNVMRWHADSYGYGYQAEIITRLLNEGATFVEVAMSNSDRAAAVKSNAFKLQNVLSVTHSLLQILFRSLRRRWFHV